MWLHSINDLLHSGEVPPPEKKEINKKVTTLPPCVCLFCCFYPVKLVKQVNLFLGPIKQLTLICFIQKLSSPKYSFQLQPNLVVGRQQQQQQLLTWPTLHFCLLLIPNCYTPQIPPPSPFPACTPYALIAPCFIYESHHAIISRCRANYFLYFDMALSWLPSSRLPSSRRVF